MLGIIPRSAVGLRGILFAPFLHGSIVHLVSNSIPFLFLGWLVMLRDPNHFVPVTLFGMIGSGLMAWLFGAPGLGSHWRKRCDLRLSRVSHARRVVCAQRREHSVEPRRHDILGPITARCSSQLGTHQLAGAPWRIHWRRSGRAPIPDGTLSNEELKAALRAGGASALVSGRRNRTQAKSLDEHRNARNVHLQTVTLRERCQR